MTRQSVRDAVDMIIEDIQSRSGLGNEWNEIDAATLLEIRQAWFEILIVTIEP
jgi:hypothetical protein